MLQPLRVVVLREEITLGAIKCKSTPFPAGVFSRPAPDLCSHLRHRIVLAIWNPYVRSIKSRDERLTSRGEGSQHLTVGDPQFHYCAAPVICDPHALAVEDDARRSHTHRECSQSKAIRRS